MVKAKLTMEEAKWQAENDARTLKEAEVIKADNARLKAAANMAAQMVKKEEAEAKAMKKIASLKKKSNSKKANKKSTSKKKK
jgi:hypothetical protein